MRKQNKQVGMDKIARRIYSKGRGWVFTASDFVDLGTREEVNRALSQLTKQNKIRRLCWGMYDFPRINRFIGQVAPPSDAVVMAIQKRDKIRVQHHGAYAANLLGLSTHVPMRTVYLTSGPTRTIDAGGILIKLQHSTLQYMPPNKLSALVIHALRWIGKGCVDKNMILTLQKKLRAGDKKLLLRDISYAPGWVADIIREICVVEKN